MKRSQVAILIYVISIIAIGLYFLTSKKSSPSFVFGNQYKETFPQSEESATIVSSDTTHSRPSTVRLITRIVKVEKNNIYVTLKARNGELEIIINADDQFLSLSAPKGVLPTKNQVWTSTTIEKVSPRLGKGEPLIIEIPFIDEKELLFVTNYKCEHEICKERKKRLLQYQKNNLVVIRAFQVGSQIPSKSVVGPLLSAVIYE